MKNRRQSHTQWGLTPLELDTVRAAVYHKKLTAAALAARGGCSEDTMKRRLRVIRLKMGVNSIVEMVAKFRNEAR